MHMVLGTHAYINTNKVIILKSVSSLVLSVFQVVSNNNHKHQARWATAPPNRPIKVCGTWQRSPTSMSWASTGTWKCATTGTRFMYPFSKTRKPTLTISFTAYIYLFKLNSVSGIWKSNSVGVQIVAHGVLVQTWRWLLLVVLVDEEIIEPNG